MRIFREKRYFSHKMTWSNSAAPWRGKDISLLRSRRKGSQGWVKWWRSCRWEWRAKWPVVAENRGWRVQKDRNLQICRCDSLRSLKCQDKNLEFYVNSHWKPVGEGLHLGRRQRGSWAGWRQGRLQRSEWFVAAEQDSLWAWLGGSCSSPDGRWQKVEQHPTWNIFSFSVSR